MILLREVMEVFELLDSPKASGDIVAQYLRRKGVKDVEVRSVEGSGGSTDFVKVFVPGSSGKESGGSAPTLGIIGRLGGVGARPSRVGMVSDADGAAVALAVAAKLGEMLLNGDVLEGDVVIATHVCPNAPVEPHHPVPFMGSPVDMATMNKFEVDVRMDAVLSVDTTRGNKVLNFKGFAITPTVKEGWILKVSEDLLRIMEYVTGKPPVVLPITMQDITPYGNGVYHINSIMQPATATDAPVVGVAITSVVPVPGCATGASSEVVVEEAARFVLEVAKAYGEGEVSFYDEEEFRRLLSLYGSMKRLQRGGSDL